MRFLGLLLLTALAGTALSCAEDESANCDTCTDAATGSWRDGGLLADASIPHSSDAGASEPADAGAKSLEECVEWQTRHPEWLHCDDFEAVQDLRVNYPDRGSAGFGVSDEDSFSGRWAIRQHYDQGQVDAGWIFWFFGDALGKDYGASHDEIFVRFFHKYESGFLSAPPKMARVSSIGAGWDKRLSVHHWIDGADLAIAADIHAPDSSQANSSGWLPIARSAFRYSEPANVGRWSCHEIQIRNNAPGQADGEVRFWADGALIVERTGLDLTGSTGYHFNAVQLDCYWNGGSPKAQSRYYDNFIVSTQRIGCAP